MQTEETCHTKDFSIVILTYNREKYIRKQLDSLSNLTDVEIIIVDNNSDDNYAEREAANFTNTKVIRLDKNYGAVGRNAGILASTKRYVVTLDDDVWGITSEALDQAKTQFENDHSVDCICFHVIDEKTNETTNWIHHCDNQAYSHKKFETYEISEGAAIFRRDCFDRVGVYPESFFISHEGPDLAFRIINSNKKIVYFPDITVTHAHAQEGRASWRRYYFDTRNLIWLAYRNYNKRLIIKRFSLQIAAMFFYSLRDGYLKYFFKGIKDSISGIKDIKGTRAPISNETYSRIKKMDVNRPSLLFYIRTRIFKKGIKI